MNIPNRQQGMVLLFSLALLLVITLLGVSTMGSSRLEIKMSANTVELQRAYQVALTCVQLSLNRYTTESSLIGLPFSSSFDDLLPDDHFLMQELGATTVNIAIRNPEPITNNGVIDFGIQCTGYSRNKTEVNAVRVTLRGGRRIADEAESNMLDL